MSVDVTEAGSIDVFAQQALARFGRIDLWVDNAGGGGMKQSGFGRELGFEALRSYTHIKNVLIATDG
jgi:NAD(P)-dependent dehydrogenase (short-subunit alcohol dehydrogenase family)